MFFFFLQYLDEFINTSQVSAFWLQKGVAGGQPSLWLIGKLLPRSFQSLGLYQKSRSLFPQTERDLCIIINTDDQIVKLQSQFLPQLSTQVVRGRTSRYPPCLVVLWQSQRWSEPPSTGRGIRQLCPYPASQTRHPRDCGPQSGSPASGSLCILTEM